jgi:hypothetical protein
MRSLFLIFFLGAVILLIMAASAKAESAGKPKYKNAEKVIAVLKTLDLDHKYLTETAEYLDAHTHDGFIYFAEQDIGGMQMQIRYDTGGFNADNLQLNFTEKGANYNITGSREGVMYRYSFRF